MAIADATVYEVRTEGDPDNGAGFKDLNPGTSVDYSQQDTAQLTLTDAATSGIGVTTLTSATGGFTAAMEGNVLYLSSGTNATVDYYQITGYTDTNTVTLDRAPDDGVGGLSGGNIKVGGASDDPGKICSSSTTMVNEAVVHVRGGASPVYGPLTTTTAGENGPINTTGFNKLSIRAYNSTRGDLDGVVPNSTSPQIDVGSLTSFTVVYLQTVNDQNTHTVMGLRVDGQDNTGVTGFDGQSAGLQNQVFSCCEALDCATGFGLNANPHGCVTRSCAVGFNDCKPVRCASYDATTRGFLVDRDQAYYCLADGCTLGFSVGDRTLLKGCAAVFCTGDGFNSYDHGSTFVDCIAANNSGHGWAANSAAFGTSRNFINCAGYQNSSGNIEHTPFVNIGFRTLTANPFADVSADDYSPNGTTNGGAELRGTGIGVPDQVVLDLGPVQRFDVSRAKQLFIGGPISAS